MCSRRRPVASPSFGQRSRISACTKSRWNEARALMTVRKKATSRNGWFGKGWFFAGPPATQGLSFPESTAFSGDDLWNPGCVWRFCQIRGTRCACLSFIPSCLLHTFTQLSLWYLLVGSVFLFLFALFLEIVSTRKFIKQVREYIREGA